MLDSLGTFALAVAVVIELHRKVPLIDVHWITSGPILHLAGVLLLLRLILSEQAAGAPRMFMALGLGPDQLTGLLNRRGFDAEAAAALDKAQEDGASAAVLMCDIDHFKSINDRYGHEIGDKVLVEIADVLRQFAVRHGALVARYGGEEFSAAEGCGLDVVQGAPLGGGFGFVVAVVEVGRFSVGAGWPERGPVADLFPVCAGAEVGGELFVVAVADEAHGAAWFQGQGFQDEVLHHPGGYFPGDL